MSIQTLAAYCRANKTGRREVRRRTRQGSDPYLKVLSSFLDDSKVAETIQLGVMDIPTDKIAGIATEETKEQYSFAFRPLAAPDGEFASKWCKLYWYYLGNQGVRCPITCYEYMGEFYIIDGIKRVSIAKCHGMPTIAASVTRIMPVKTENEAVARYYEQVKSVDRTGLYQVEFSRPDSFARFQEAMGHAPDYRWNEADRLDFLFNWYTFEHAFREAFNNYLDITPADAFLVLLEEHPYEKLREMSPMLLVHMMRKSWRKLNAIQNSVKHASAGADDTN